MEERSKRQIDIHKERQRERGSKGETRRKKR